MPWMERVDSRNYRCSVCAGGVLVSWNSAKNYVGVGSRCDQHISFVFQWTPFTPQAPFCGFLIFLIKKGIWVKLYVWIHTIARSKEHVPMSSEWYLDIFNSTYFDVFMNFVDQKVFKKTIINQKHDFHGQYFVVIRIWSKCYVVERSRCLVRAYLQNTITFGVEFEHCEQLAKSIQIEQI